MKEKGYTGRVASFRPNDNYGFIAIESVSASDGKRLDSEHDVFIHQDECATPLRAGLVLRFEVATDLKRGNGTYRAQKAVLIGDDMLPAHEAPIPGLAVISSSQGTISVIKERSPHYGMKEVPIEEVAKVLANQPLKDVPRDDPEAVELNGDPGQLVDILSAYLFTQFPGLQNLGLDHKIVGFDQAAEEELVAQALKGYSDLGMTHQIQLTQEEFKRYKATRSFLAWILQQGWILPGARVSPAVIGSLVTTIRSLNNSDAKAKALNDLKQAFGFMGDRGLLRPSTVLPLRYLPDLCVAAPVWFFDLHEPREVETARLGQSKREQPDPQVHPATKDICDLFPNNDRWCDFFQMFNRRCRSITLFQGDIIPLSVAKLIRDARGVFDRVAILTPYLDIAGADWIDVEWLRSIDPYVVGFKNGCPVFFVLARFSDTGVFPLLDELTADTMLFLRQNSPKLLGFDQVSNPYWHSHTPHWIKGSLGRHLVTQVDEMQRAYESGHLFDWLRNEWTENGSTGQQLNASLNNPGLANRPA
jgi:cold shock CspA family protein